MHASTLSSLSLTERDKKVLNDMIRFGALTREHLEVRFERCKGDDLPELQRLLDDGFVHERPAVIKGTRFFVATSKAQQAVDSHLAAITQNPDKSLLHNLTLVNLADWLVPQYTNAVWLSERELNCGPCREEHGLPANTRGHRPDGLLINGRYRKGIELEFEWCTVEKYASVCRWFAEHGEFNAVHWFVGDDLLMERIPRIVERHGLALDIDIYVDWIPNEVEVLRWA